MKKVQLTNLKFGIATLAKQIALNVNKFRPKANMNITYNLYQLNLHKMYRPKQFLNKNVTFKRKKTVNKIAVLKSKVSCQIRYSL